MVSKVVEKKELSVCTETLSKFSPADNLQIAGSTGDGACAISVKSSDEWKVKGLVHGTDGRYLKNMYVPGRYPVPKENYRPEDYVFTLEAKADSLQILGKYWVDSLKDVLELSEVSGDKVNHYISHQVDAEKNNYLALQNNIPATSISTNIKDFGNMGCPTIFLNYKAWTEKENHSFSRGRSSYFPCSRWWIFLGGDLFRETGFLKMSLNNDELLIKIKSIIENNDDLDAPMAMKEITFTTKFNDDLHFDSLGKMSLIYELQEEFSHLDESELDQWTTISDLIDAIKK